MLRGAEHEAVLWNGAVLELAGARGAPRLGPDILGEPPDFETMLARLRGGPQEREVGDALLDQRLVAGIGNIWKAEALWEARVSPWRRLGEVDDSGLRAVLEAAHALMRASLDGPRPVRAGLPPCGPRSVLAAAASSAPRHRAKTRAPPTGARAVR